MDIHARSHFTNEDSEASVCVCDSGDCLRLSSWLVTDSGLEPWASDIPL